MGFFRQEYWSGLPFPSPGAGGRSSQPRDHTWFSCICRQVVYQRMTKKKKSSVIFSALRKPSEFSPISPLIGGNNRRCLYGGGGCTSACWKPCSEGSELCLGDEDFCKRSDESCYRRTHSGKEQPSSLLNTSYLTQYSRILLVCLDGSWVCDSN